TGVFVDDVRGEQPSGEYRTVIRLDRFELRWAQLIGQTDVDQFGHVRAGALGGRREQQCGLVRAECYRASCVDGGPGNGAAVDVDARWHVDGKDARAGDGVGQLCREIA